MSSPLNASQPIVDDARTMEQPFRDYMNLLARYIPLNGEGSPEGAVEATQFRSYINTTGTPGTLLYIKMLPNIGGDKKQGWVAV